MNVAAVVATPKLTPAAPEPVLEPVAMQTWSSSGVSTSPPQQALQTAHPLALQGVSSAFVHPQVSTLTMVGNWKEKFNFTMDAMDGYNEES